MDVGKERIGMPGKPRALWWIIVIALAAVAIVLIGSTVALGVFRPRPPATPPLTSSAPAKAG